MNTKIKPIILSLLLAAGIRASAQQDIQFSQYAFTGLLVNPAYAGYREDLNLSAIYRQQWVGFPGAPRTTGITLDGLTNTQGDRIGLGLSLTDDKLGPQQTTDLYGYFSYRIPMDMSGSRRLCLGFGAGFTQYALDGSAFQYVDANDPAIPLGAVSTIKPDGRLGIYYYTPDFYIGASVLGLLSVAGDRQIFLGNNKQYGSILEAPHAYLTAGGVVELSDEVKLKPAIMLQEDFKGPTNADLNLFLLLDDRLWVGGSYRSAVKLWNKPYLQSALEASDAASCMIEYYATPNLRIGYAYDFTTSGLSSYQYGSHEVSIGLTLPAKKNKERISSPRYF